MTWLYYAGYQNPIDGERAVANLLEQGVPPEDISLVAKLADGEASEEVSVDYEPVLAGVESTSEPLVSMQGDPSRSLEGVSGVEELDDSSNVAENMSEPLNDEWYGLQEEKEALEFANTGWIHDDSSSRKLVGEVTPTATSQISSIAIGGEAVLLGDGKLATNMLAQLVEHPGDVLKSLKRTLWQLGLAPEPALKLSDCYESGGAVLTVTETASAIPIQDIESLVGETNPIVSGTFVDTETVTLEPHA